MAGCSVITWASGTFEVALRKWASGWPYVWGKDRPIVWAPERSAAVVASPSSTLTVVPWVNEIAQILTHGVPKNSVLKLKINHVFCKKYQELLTIQYISTCKFQLKFNTLVSGCY